MPASFPIECEESVCLVDVENIEVAAASGAARLGEAESRRTQSHATKYQGTYDPFYLPTASPVCPAAAFDSFGTSASAVSVGWCMCQSVAFW